MSSGFVSAGTTEEPIERDDEWRKAQEIVEANFRRKQEQGKQDGGKSLYEVLQQNKAAKQEAFEESIRLKNQFRTLDDDEVEFLDSVLESTRAREAAVRKETAEQLEAFRLQQEAAEKALLDESVAQPKSNMGAASPTDSETWTTSGKKRRRPKEKDTLTAKLRKTSSTTEPETPVKRATEAGAKDQTDPREVEESPPMPPDNNSKKLSANHSPSTEQQSSPKASSQERTPPVASALGLGFYSSDED